MIDIDKLKAGDKVVCTNSSYCLTEGGEYEVLDTARPSKMILVIDNDGYKCWWNIDGFKLKEAISTITEKNFSVSVVGKIFCVEAIGLSEEKINKIIDILAK